MLIYSSKVISVGQFAPEFFQEDIMVFFGAKAPEELQEHAIVLEHAQPPHKDIVVGDRLCMDGQSLTVTAVGSLVNENFRNLGHLVAKLNVGDHAEMDGDLNVAGARTFTPGSGSRFQIKRGFIAGKRLINLFKKERS